MGLYQFFSVEALKNPFKFQTDLFLPPNYAALVFNVNKILLSVKHNLSHKEQSTILESQMFG